MESIIMTIKFETLKEWFLKLNSTYERQSQFEIGKYKDRQYLNLEIKRYDVVDTDKRNSVYLRYWENSNDLNITYNEDSYDSERDSYENLINDDDCLNIIGITTYNGFVNKINSFCKESHDRWTPKWKLHK